MKKITFVFFICFCAVGFSQTQISTMGPNNPIVYETNKAVQQGPVTTATPLSSLGEEKNASFYGVQEERQVFNSSSSAKNISANGAQRNAAVTQNILVRTQQMNEEIQAAALWRATNPATTSSRPVENNMPSANLLADFIPTAGATETFTPAVGDNFFDPGGPGGSSTGGSPGNYPNCGCDTVTTLDGVTEIEFLDFSVFATFDYVRIYDGADTSGTLLYDNGSGGTNSGDITLADMIASNGSASFVGTSGALTFFFHSSTVVDYGGWDVEIIAATGGGGGGGGAACDQSHAIATDVGGLGSSVDSDFKTASDIVVTAGEDFTIDTIDTYFLTFAPSDPPTTATIVYYDDAAGFPGAVLGSETVVPTIVNAQPWVNPVADEYEITMAVTPFTFAGDAGADTTYWIEISMGTATNQATVFWENTIATPVEGSPAVQFDATLGTWSIPDPVNEVIYTYSGECAPMGGGSVACDQSDVSNAFENGLGNTNAGIEVADEIIVAADTDFEVNQVTVNIINNGGFNDVVVAFYENNGGLPGTQIGTFQTVVPTSSTVVGAAFGRDVNQVVLDITPVMLPGTAGAETVYWLGIETPNPVDPASDAYYETTSIANAGTDFVVAADVSNGGWTATLPVDAMANNVYTVSGECTSTGGGGGGATCEAENASNAFENGFFNNVGGAFTTANDLIVNDGEQFEMNQVTLNLFHDVGATITSVNFFYYDNAGTIPGTLIGSELAVAPVSQTVIGNNFGFDVSEVVLDITPFVFEGENGSATTYWVETTVVTSVAGTAAWEATSASAIGFPSQSYDIANATWITQIEDGVYTFAGDCNPIAPDPTYDTCDGALPIMCGDTVAGSTIGATEDSAVAPTCDTTVTAPGVWYKYEDTTGLVTDITVTMCEGTTDYDTKLSVYTGDCGAPPFTCVAGNDDSCGLQSEVTFQSDGATTFYILVHGFGTSTGNFELTMNCTPVPPPNDMIANSIDVDEAGFPYVDPSVAMPAATTEAGTPAGCDNAGAKGVWYNFIPTGDGEVTATITSPAGVSSVTFYTAPNESSTETDLVLVDWYLNQCVPGTTATIPAVAGQAYYAYVVNHGGITDIQIDYVLGVEDNAIEGFSYYPNPADATINLQSVDTIDSVTIFNILGQKVLDQTVNATTSQFDVSNLTTGTYLMKVSVNGQTGVYKILKN